MTPRLKVTRSLRSTPPMDKDRAREQIAASKLTHEQALIAAIRVKLHRLWMESKRASVHDGGDWYDAQQFADEVRDLLERPR